MWISLKILNHGITTSDQIDIDIATRQELMKVTEESPDNFPKLVY
jgi:hypothetical protein